MSDTVPAEVAKRVRAAARDRCGYCLSPQRLVMARLEIEHIVPRSKGGDNEESNLWLSCPLCAFVGLRKGMKDKAIVRRGARPILHFAICI